MNTSPSLPVTLPMSRGKRIAYALLPLAVLLLIDMVPVSHAAEIIPEKTTTVAAADTAAPSDVENLKATAADGAVTLTWNVSTDNVGVKGYKLYYGTKSVTTDGGSYDKGPIDVGNKITYTVTGLTNGTKYFFAMTAYDAAGNESENYSVEVGSTPLHGAADKEAPKVTKAEAVDRSHVKVSFSEAVQLPVKNPENAFSVKNDTTSVQLQVKSAKMNTADFTGKSVLLETANQQAGASYILTAGIDVKDTAGNPIVSGTSDTAVFTGTDLVASTQQATQQATQQTAQGPQLASVQALDGTHVQVTFDKKIVLSKNPLENFIVTEEQTIENTLDVLAVELAPTGLQVLLTTAPMKAIGYNLIAVDIKDAQGNQLSVENNATVFTGMAAAPAATQQATQQSATQQSADTVAPEDVTGFTAAMVKQLIVTLNWTRSLNSAGDLAKYVLYMSTDGKDFGAGIDVSPTANSFDVTNIVPGVKYFFKLVAMDALGNTSAGVMTTFTLPQTGPELGLLLFGSFGLGKLLKRKKNKKSVRK